MKQINLLPKTELKELKLQFFADDLISFWIWVVVSLLLVVATIYVTKTNLSGQLSDVESVIVTQQQQVKSSDNEALKVQVDNLNGKIGTVKTLLAQNNYWSHALVELSKLLSPDISLNTMSVTSTGTVNIAGIAGSRDSVLKFWSDMNQSTYFRNINFPLSNLTAAQQDSFSFKFQINPDKLKQP